MTAHDAQVFFTISSCFGPASEDDWKACASSAAWSEFLTATRRLLQDERPLGAALAPIAHARTSEPFGAFLSVDEVRAIYAPPSYEEKHAFAARHFTGGLPTSAVPVESLYVKWSDRRDAAPFAQREGLYRSDVALYMDDLLSALGYELPDALASTPDHLAVECAVVAALLEDGSNDHARSFLLERTAWLETYRARLRRIGDDALFYLALVDVLLGVRAMQLACTSVSDDEHAA